MAALLILAGLILWIVPGVVLELMARKSSIRRQWSGPVGALIKHEFAKIMQAVADATAAQATR